MNVLPSTDVTAFRAACFAAVRHLGGHVDQVQSIDVASFHTATITDHRTRHVVLCHRHLPVIAFTTVPPTPGQPVSGFVEPPSWQTSFAAAGLRTMTVTELNLPISQVDTSELAPAELAQIHHWRPALLSDLLFNWWD